MARPASYSVEIDKTNKNLKNGDRVVLLEHMDGHCSATLTVLAGTEGIVVNARTPKVTQLTGSSPFFANVDCKIGNATVRVRPYHYQLRRQN